MKGPQPFDEIAHEIVELLAYGSAPLSILFPELRLSIEDDVGIDIALGILAALVELGLLDIWQVDENGSRKSLQPQTLEIVRLEYELGVRDANRVEQILDRVDVWYGLSSKALAIRSKSS